MDRLQKPGRMEDYDSQAATAFWKGNRVRSGLNNDRLREAGRMGGCNTCWVNSLVTSVSDFDADWRRFCRVSEGKWRRAMSRWRGDELRGKRRETSG